MVFMAIKVVALDIHGTILASDDYDNVVIPRRGLERFFNRCSDRDAIVVGASDSINAINDIDAVARYHNLPWLIEGFWDFYTLDGSPKDFSHITLNEKVNPRELLVIGDNKDNKDRGGAEAIGAHFILVPPYSVTLEDNFSFDQIDLSKY